jgi:hypothetical protein
VPDSARQLVEIVAESLTEQLQVGLGFFQNLLRAYLASFTFVRRSSVLVSAITAGKTLWLNFCIVAE